MPPATPHPAIFGKVMLDTPTAGLTSEQRALRITPAAHPRPRRELLPWGFGTKEFPGASLPGPGGPSWPTGQRLGLDPPPPKHHMQRCVTVPFCTDLRTVGNSLGWGLGTCIATPARPRSLNVALSRCFTSSSLDFPFWEVGSMLAPRS